MRAHVIAALAALSVTACSSMPSMSSVFGGGDSGAPAKNADGTLIGPKGMTLYTLDRDPADASRSVCNGACATNWPPFAAPADAKGGGDFKVVKRDDGSMQWAYKGKPLYYWAKDQKPGDRSGDGINNVWHVAKP